MRVASGTSPRRTHNASMARQPQSHHQGVCCIVCVATCVLFPQGVVMATWPYSKGVGRELGGSGGSWQWHRNSGGRGGQIDVK